MPDDPIDGDPLDGDLTAGDPLDGPEEDAAELEPAAEAAAQSAGEPPDDPPAEAEALSDEFAGTTAGAGDEPPPSDSAFEDAGGDPSTADAPAAPAEADAAILVELSSIVGSDADALYAFGRGAGETAVVGLESVANQRVSFQSVVASIAEFSELARDYEGVPHVGLELRVALDEAEVYAMAVILRLEDLGTLLSIETSPEQMADEEFAAAQIEVVSGSVREFLDLAGLMLFSDELAGAEVTLGEVRANAIEATVAALSEAAGEPIGLRVDFALVLPDGASAPVALAAPAGLVARLAALSAAAPAEEAAEPDQPPEVDLAAMPSELSGVAAGAGPGFPDLPGLEGFGGPAEDVAVHPVRFPTLGPSDPRSALPSSIDMILDVSLRVTVELGRSNLTVQEVLALGPGSVVELNKLAGEPVDILINDRPIARGEVVVVDENFGVRVTEVLSPRSRIEAVGR